MYNIRLFVPNTDIGVTLPINPRELRFGRVNDHKSADIVGMGEIVIPGKAGLMRFSIDCFFWDGSKVLSEHSVSAPRPTDLTNAIRTMQTQVQRPGRPLQFVAEGIGVNTLVLIENFEVSVRAKQETDRYYTLDLVEYREYGAKVVEVKHVEVPREPETVKAEARSAVIEDGYISFPPAPSAPPPLQIGQIVDFIGGFHYVSSTSASPANSTPRSAGKANLTNIKKGALRPLHLIGLSHSGKQGSNVYGWVDEQTVAGVLTEAVHIAPPPTPPRADTRPEPTNPYVTVAGDTLVSIAIQQRSKYDNVQNTQELLDRNPYFRSTDISKSLPPGTKIILPSGGPSGVGPSQFTSRIQ